MEEANKSEEIRHGREAEKPKEVPKLGWRDVLARTKNQIQEDNVDIVAAGVSFYVLLSLPFVLSALVSIYGILADPAEIQRQMSGLEGVIPADAHALIAEQLTRISSQQTGTLTFTFVGSILLALWSGSKAVKSLITALNIAYEEREKRGYIKLNLYAMFLTLVGIVGVVVAVTLVAGVPVIIDALPLPAIVKGLTTYLRWPLLAALALLGLAFLYRYAPSRERAQWKWVSWGAVAATGFWIVGSLLFSWYVSSFAKYNETYGSLGAVVVMLMWTYVSAFIAMLGAELNAELEHQTRKDTTTGEARPMGERGAKMADTLGATHEKTPKKGKVA